MLTETKQLLFVFWIILLSSPIYAQLFINEVVSFNDNTIADNYGEFDDWIEIYNAGNSAINLANYYISDDTLTPLKFKFPTTNATLTTVPANGYLILWADDDLSQGENHLNFKLNSGGEQVVITAIDGLTQIDLLSYSATTVDQSFGRKPDGALSTFVFSSNTPNSSNNNAAQKADPVDISPVGGVMTSTQTVTLTTALSGASIFYTTDGSVPTSSSSYYNGPFTVSTNKSIRAVTVKSGYENSYPSTETYVFNYSTDLPVIFITIPPVDFDSDMDGMYVVGTNGITENCTSYPANFNQNWEKEVNITLYETDGTQVLNQTAGAQISGGCSRMNPLRSFNIAAKDEYGYSHFKHQLFPNYEQDKFKRFKLRNSGNNATTCYIRDVVGQKIIEGQVDIDQQRSRPVAAFINGEYWGYYYMRDWFSEHFVDENHKIADKDSIDMIRGTGQWAFPIYSGTGTYYNNMWTYFNQQTSISNSEYQYIKDNYIDIDEYVNYNIAQIFVANTDWPGNNQRQWREQNGGVFRYMLYDTDFGYARNQNTNSKTYSDWDRESMDFVTNTTTSGWPNDPTSTLIFRKLLTNTAFKNDFIQSFGSLLSIVYPYSRTSIIFNDEKAKVANERPEFYARWHGQPHPNGYNISVSDAITQNHYTRIDDFLSNRPDFMYTHLVDFFNLTGTYDLTIPLTSNGNGRVVLNSNEYLAPYSYTGKYFDGIPITLKAIPNPGYRFSHWQETAQTTATITSTFSSNTTRTPIFVPALDVVVNEIHFHPSDSINEKEFIEIHNPDTEARDLTGYMISSGFCFEFPDGSTIQPNEYIIIAKDASQYTGNGYQVFQWQDSKLSNSGENIILQNSIGGTLDSVDYSDNLPWPLLSDGFGRSLELDFPVPSNNEDGNNWHASAATNGSPGAQNSMPCTAATPAIVINEINYNSNDQSNPGDWVELYNNSNANINISGWKFYDSENSYSIPSSTTLPKNEYLVIAQDVNLFNGIFPHLQSNNDVIGDFDFFLSSGGERIGLYNSNECPVDELRYNDKLPWDSIPDGNGPTLSLINPSSDNTLPASWEGSDNINAPLGTPGRINGPCPNFSITTPSSICSGEAILLHTTTNSNATFTWTIQGGNPATSTGDSIYVTFPNAGLAFVTLNYTYFECSNSTQSLVTAQACNTAPTPQPDSYVINEDNPLTDNVLTNDTDPEGNPLSASLVSGVSNGNLTLNSNGSFTYTPAANYYGSDGFTYQVCDNAPTPLCATETVTITINSINDVPSAVNDSYSGLEDSQLTGNVLTNDSDVDGNPLTASVATAPSNGTVSLNANGNFTYTPNANYFGNDSFTYQVCDNGSPFLCSNGSVSISLAPVNDPPVSTTDAYSVNEDNSINDNVLTNDSDIENHTLSASVNTNVSNGTLSLNTNGSFTYTPNLNYNGSDGFTYQVCDNGVPTLCATETVTITVNPVNDAPTTNSDLFTTNEDTQVTGNVLTNDSDADGNALSASVSTTTSNGSLTLQANGSFTYTPNANYFGSDQFVYEVCDNGTPSLCLTENVTISITPVNDAPTATADNLTISEDSSGGGNVLTNDSDIENQPLTASIISIVSNGTLTLSSSGNYNYIPNANFNGLDNFTYEVCDNASPALCDTETVTITVTSVNDAPSTISDLFTTNEDTPITGNVLTNDSDIDGNTLSASINTTTSNGTLTLQANGSFNYTPNANYFGSDQFVYEVCDNGSPSICVTENVNISISPVNDAPIATADHLTIIEDGSGSGNVLTNDLDAENQSLTATISSNVSNGTLTLTPNGTYSYVPYANFNGSDNFSYEVCDNASPTLCDTETVTITVTSVNDAPSTTSDLFTTTEDTPIIGDVLTNDSDIDGDSLTTTINTTTSNGTLTLQANGSFNYSPNANYFGSDQFVYEACDNGSPSICVTENVNISVSPVNDAPIPTQDNFTISEDATLINNVLTNDSDPENNALSITLVANVGNGNLTLNGNGDFTYTPSPNYFGSDNFIYEVCDNGTPSLCATANVNIIVNSVNDAPTSLNDSFTGTEDNQIAENVLMNDSDVDGNNLSATMQTPPLNGTITLLANGNFIYDPNPNYFGSDVFTYQVCDDGSPILCEIATVNMNITPVNDPPIAIADNFSVNEDNLLSNNVLTNDSEVENQPITSQLLVDCTNGSLSLNTDGSFSYVPNTNFYGTDSFVYEVCDDTTPTPMCTQETATINVLSVNDQPIVVNDTLSTGEGVQVAGNASTNDYDVETNPMNYTLLSFNNGVVLFNFDGSFYYTPFAGFSGIDSFQYRACDNGTPNYCETATVYIDVIPDCVTLDIALNLEGAYDLQTGLMNTTLNTARSVLPGMTNNPVAGQPYDVSPWLYFGNEGSTWTDANYNATVVDWVLISFRTGVEKSTEVLRIAGILHADGTVEFPETCISVQELSGSFYVVAEHRNHMASMSSVKVSMVNRTLSWDFRSANSYTAGGNGAKELTTGVWALYAGDCNQVDDVVSYDINGKDKSTWLTENGNFGIYLNTDINMNGDVNGSDKAMWLLNNGVFGSVKK